MGLLGELLYEAAARGAFTRLSPDQRARFGEFLQSQARARDFNLPAPALEARRDQLQEPGLLAQMAAHLHQHEPGLLGNLLGGEGVGEVAARGTRMLDSNVGKAVMGGIAAIAIRQMMRRR